MFGWLRSLWRRDSRRRPLGNDSFRQLAEQISKLSLAEAEELVGILQAEYGHLPPPTAPGLVDTGERDSFVVTLTSLGPEPEAAIEALEQMLNVSEEEARRRCESLPCVLHTNASRAFAQEAWEQLDVFCSASIRIE